MGPKGATHTAARPAAVAPVGLGPAMLLTAALVIGAGLVGVGVVGLFPSSGAPLMAARASIGPSVPVPTAPRAAPGLRDRRPTVAFEADGSELPGGPLGPWQEVSGDWAAGGGTAAVIEGGRRSSLAVVEAPAGSTTVQVTLTGPWPSAGVVTSYVSATRYVALVVDASGRRVTMVRVDDDGDRSTTLIEAHLQSPDAPLVLALRRDGGRIEAFANGLALGRRVVRDPGGTPRVGLVAGPGQSGREPRFDDLVVA